MNNEETLKIIEKLEEDWKEHPTFGKKEYMDVLKRVKDSLENADENGLNNVVEKFEKGEINGSEFEKQQNKIFFDYLNEHPSEETEKLTNQFKKDGIPVQVTHLNIKKVYE